ncbi:MAG: hypothetical protein KIT33_15340 [Candidatus Kapabacteria bacterium]|nr:hypothetical protein [Ignavibacteriota bacterium]MCW5886343.1 hypothetical protein [Candidatus Kapabacteria bacterium]
MKFELSINNKIINKGDIRAFGWVNATFTPQQLMQHILNGYAYSQGVIKPDVGTKKPKVSDISHAQLLSVDVDNDIIDPVKKVKRCKTYDEGYLSWDAIMEDPWYHENALLAYTTASHSDKHHKFRIVFLLPEIIYEPSKYKEIVSVFIEKYHGDSQCSNFDRLFFGNTNATYYVFGNQLSISELNNILSIPSDADIQIEKSYAHYNERYSNEKLTESQVADMLSYIPSQMAYEDWGKIVSAIGNYFNESTAVRLIENWSPDTKQGTLYKVRHRSKRPTIASVIYYAAQNGFDKKKLHSRLSISKKGRLVKDDNENVDVDIAEDVDDDVFNENDFFEQANIQRIHRFWFEQSKVKQDKDNPSNDKSDYVLKINKTKMIEYLEDRGYRKHWLDKKTSILVQVTDNIVEMITEERIIDFIKNEIKAFPYRVSQMFNRNDLMEVFLNQINNLGSKQFLRMLSAIEEEFVFDSKNEAYFFFENSVVKITKDNYYLFKYTELNGFIWKEQIIDKPINNIFINLNDNEDDSNDVGQFELFLKKVCSPKTHPEQQRHDRTVDDKRFYSLISAIGYMLHTFKDPTVTKAVILCEEKIAKGDESNGRTGKGLTAKAIGKLRKQVLFNGKNIDFNSPFFYQTVDPDTQIIYFDDVERNFNFEKLFSDLTEGISITQKGQKPVIIPYEKSPKFLISTNAVLSNDSDSHKARKFEIEYSDYFDAEYQPSHEFGNFFFNEGWDKDSKEWDLFYSFMMSCTMVYLNQGLIPYEPMNLSERKLLTKMPEAFIEFADELIESISNKDKIYREKLYEDFTNKNKMYGPSGKNATTQTRTTKWFNDYLTFKNIDFIAGMNSLRDDRRKFWEITKSNSEDVDVNYDDNLGF